MCAFRGAASKANLFCYVKLMWPFDGSTKLFYNRKHVFTIIIRCESKTLIKHICIGQFKIYSAPCLVNNIYCVIKCSTVVQLIKELQQL